MISDEEMMARARNVRTAFDCGVPVDLIKYKILLKATEEITLREEAVIRLRFKK